MEKESVFVYISAIRFERDLAKYDMFTMKSIIEEKLNLLKEKLKDGLISFKRYFSLRHNCDLIVWISSFETSAIFNFRFMIKNILLGLGYEDFSLLSLYKPSPYQKKVDLASYLKLEPLRYFIAYPMKKTPDWYLIPFEEREEMMREHISIAVNHPKAKGIRSYTTYSFGIADDEFVVIYEVPSLETWVEVVEKLREAKVRKWTLREEPVLVGENF